jgi:hypothetical protein
MFRELLAGIVLLFVLAACSQNSAATATQSASNTPAPTSTISSEQMTAYATYRATLPASFTPTFTPTVTLTPTASLTPTQTLTPSITPLPSQIPPPPFTLDLSSLVVLTPSNFHPNQHLASFPATGDNDQLFMSPDMAYFFTVSVPADGNYLANVYRFPEMELVTESLPLASLPNNAFTSTIGFSQDSRLMTSFRVNGDEAIFYQVGESSYLVDSEEGRIIHAGDMNNSGILALSVANQQGAEELCLSINSAAAILPMTAFVCRRTATFMR